MHDDLAHALRDLAVELRASRHERREELVTKKDLALSETRIIAAFRGVSLSEAEKITASLRASSDEVAKAVAAHSPINENPK